MTTVTPFLRWAGGKRHLAPALIKLMPTEFKRYHEPFVGAGAVFFALRPAKATLSDANVDLMTTYQALRDDPSGVIRRLNLLKDTSAEAYTQVREWQPKSDAQVAARLIYLNKCCFNGLYRVNLAGQFNVPRDTKLSDRASVFDETHLRAVSERLQGVILQAAPFDQSLVQVRKGDLVYLDPPYDTTHAAYTNKGFTPQQHEQLAAWFFRLAHLGAYPVLTNSDTPLVRKLYKGATLLPVVGRNSITPIGSERSTPTAELIIIPKRRKS